MNCGTGVYMNKKIENKGTDSWCTVSDAKVGVFFWIETCYSSP